MTAWFSREAAAAGAAQTHALVVGVSYYQFLPQGDSDPAPADRETFGLRQAHTPATSAWQFANWLADSYNNPAAPLGTIRLLLSPSEWEKTKIPQLANLTQVTPATRENVQQAVDEWHDAANSGHGNVAILYASGHGIQLSKDDGGIVLLEDFARRPNAVLEHSLDVGAVRHGMAGKTMAQRQFYFVDACQVRPRKMVDFQTMGRGVDLQNPFEGAARCSAVYFSAAPSTEALGEPGSGTLFIQALLDCLKLEAVDEHAHDESWVVTSGSLMKALPRRVAELAMRYSREQTGTTGGQIEDVIFHVLPRAPDVPLELELDPAEATACVLARLWDGIDAETSVFNDERFDPVIEKLVPAGQYVLTVRIDPPTPGYRELPALPIPALPPSFSRRVTVR